MGMTAQEYKNQLVQLFPKGKAWDLRPDGDLDRLLSGLAAELVRADARGDDLQDEADPRTTFELLEDWERVLGLPDDCVNEEPTLEGRRARIVAKLTTLGGQSISFFKALAVSVGYEVEIEEYDIFKVGDRVGERLYGIAWMHAFSVISPANSERPFRVQENVVGERLMEFGDDLLECVITREKPAHSTVIFQYE